MCQLQVPSASVDKPVVTIPSTDRGQSSGITNRLSSLSIPCLVTFPGQPPSLLPSLAPCQPKQQLWKLEQIAQSDCHRSICTMDHISRDKLKPSLPERIHFQRPSIPPRPSTSPLQRSAGIAARRSHRDELFRFLQWTTYKLPWLSLRTGGTQDNTRRVSIGEIGSLRVRGNVTHEGSCPRGGSRPFSDVAACIPMTGCRRWQSRNYIDSHSCDYEALVASM
jgi:hypothetical protein